MSTKLNALVKDDICALATPVGFSAIAVIRLSGPNALSILKGISKKKGIIKSHNSFLSPLYSDQEEKIDQALVTYFEEGKSYTGESSFEISCHGNPNIVKKIIDRLIQLGARLAEKGEFTFRAFLNNKIDLVQAESVLSLIESQSEKAAKVSLRQLEGHTSKLFKEFESDIIWCLAHIEASIDFSTEGLDVIDNNLLVKKLTDLSDKLKNLSNSYIKGQILKDGLKIALIGKPNVGKSSLMNVLVQADKSIVTPIAGTTRDTIEASTMFNDIKFIITDTAGIRETNDAVEQIGVERSKSEISKSDLKALILDVKSDNLEEELASMLDLLKNKNELNNFVILVNKKDLANSQNISELNDKIEKILQKTSLYPVYKLNKRHIFISALDSNCRNLVMDLIISQFESLDFLNESIISSSRQLEMINHAIDSLSKSINELNDGMGSEFIAQTLKDGLLAIQKILGEVYDDQILDRVFKEFCLGK